MREVRTIGVVALAAMTLGGCFGKKQAAPAAGSSAEPDKLLFDRAEADIKHGRYITGRLDLQTLINTYPDSEFLAKAKLEIADSYYKEGGTAGLKQSISEYKDFITFFPFLDEAAYAQMQMGMAHYRQMGKPDRDRTEAIAAEAEFQTFLEKYPNSKYRPEAEQKLRDVQEVIAEGNFRVVQFYWDRQNYRAAGARLLELTNRYPLYSHADEANYMLAQIYEKTEHNEIAGKYYSKIVKEYPLSPLVADSKKKLTKFGVPIPPADPVAVARMKEDENVKHPNLLHRSMGVLKNSPDISAAAQAGMPTMTPASESGDETIGMAFQPQTANNTSGSSVGSTATVETVTPGTSGSATASDGSSEPSNGTGGTAASAESKSAASTPAETSSDSAQEQSTTAAAGSSSAQANNQPVQESSSKKKKGLRKVIPF